MQRLALAVAELSRLAAIVHEAVHIVVVNRRGAKDSGPPGYEAADHPDQMIDALRAVPLGLHFGHDRIDTGSMRPILQPGPKAGRRQ